MIGVELLKRALELSELSCEMELMFRDSNDPERQGYYAGVVFRLREEYYEVMEEYYGS